MQRRRRRYELTLVQLQDLENDFKQKQLFFAIVQARNFWV